MARADLFVNKFVDLYSQSQGRSAGLMDDPTVMGFNIWFHFPDLPSGLNKTPSPLFAEQPGSDSAINYLESIGEPARAKSLRDFKERLRLLVYDTPYYFQTLEGMNGLNKFDPTTPFRANDRKITINTLESIDMRVATMIARYMESVYDFRYHRLIVPPNLLYFTCYVSMCEIRNFRKVVNAKAENEADRYQRLSETLVVHTYKFEMCTFDFEGSNPWMDSVDNKGGDFTSNRFDIKLGIIEEGHTNMTFMQLTGGDSSQENPLNTVAPLPIAVPRESNINPDVLNPKKVELGGIGLGAGYPVNILDRAKQTAKYVEEEILKKGNLLQQKFSIKTLANRALNDLFDVLDSRIRGFILGNVFSDLNQFIQDDFYTSAKEFVANINKGQSVKTAATNAFGQDGPPEIMQTKINELGQVALVYLKQQEVQLGNVAGFSTDPFKAIENQVITGALGNIFTGGA